MWDLMPRRGRWAELWCAKCLNDVANAKDAYVGTRPNIGPYGTLGSAYEALDRP